MLAAAICKHEGFTYNPSETEWWNHGFSTESDFIYVTTQVLTEEQLLALSEDVGSNRTLLICCAAYRVADKLLNGKLSNLTIKKIPNAVMSKCEWGKDDYSLNISNLPQADIIEEPQPIRKKAASKEADLFDIPAADNE
jgi:adenine-specific DNA-methyltransferase